MTTKIGNYQVYDNQIEAADKYFDYLMGQNIPVLCSMPQMGKTGTIIYVVNLILQYCSENNLKDFKIIHVLHDANNDVRDQTELDYSSAFGGNEDYLGYSQVELFGISDKDKDKKLHIIHRVGLSAIEPSKDSNTTYFILHDESHAAINKGGLIDKWRKQIADDSKIYEGHCSATPFPFHILNNPPNYYPPVILSPSKFYYGIPDYYRSKRIKPAHALFMPNEDNERVLSFEAFPILEDFVNKVKINGPGHVIIRDRKFSEANEFELIQTIDVVYGLKASITYFNADKTNNNIKYIANQLVSKPKSDINFIIIKGALRLGKRVSKQFIRGIIDTVKAQSGATTFQSLLGRMCGNDVNNLDFNIYCDCSEIELYVKWWVGLNNGDDPLSLPSSQYNNKNVNKHIKYIASPPGAFLKRPIDQEVKQYMEKNKYPFKIGDMEVKPHIIVRKTSTNRPTTGKDGRIYHTNNIASAIVNGSARSTRIKPNEHTMEITAAHMDGASIHYISDWDKAIKMGYKLGEHILFFPIKTAWSPEDPNKKHLTSNCMFNTEEE